MQPALSQICSLPVPFERQIREYAAGKCETVELWLTTVEEHLKKTSVADTRRLLDDVGISASVASQQGGLLAAQGEHRREAWELFHRRLGWMAELGVRTVVVSCDVPAPLESQAIDRVRVSLTQLAQAAGEGGVRVALEFQARSAFGNNLQTAAALVAEVASPHLGLCVDAFHYFVGPSRYEDQWLLSRENLFHVQLCDLADIPRELATDSHRILPGDGDFAIAPLVERLKEIQYDGAVSVEVMNPQLWNIDPRQFGEIAMTALRRLLGLARMDA